MLKKVFTMSVDDKMAKVLDELKQDFSRPSRAEVIRLAVALLKIAMDARNSDRKLCIIDSEGKILETILLPA